MDEHQHLNMSVSTLQVTSIPEISGTKIFSFGCRVPANLQQHDPSLMSDENVDFDDALKIQSMDNKSAKLLQQSDVELIEKNGIVGTVTIFGRSTAMVWVGWGRLHEQHSQDVSEIITQRSLGSASNQRMGPLMVSIPWRTHRGAFASENPSSKLINVSDLESDLLASQMSQRISQQVQMVILVSCHFDDAVAPTTFIGTDDEHHMLRRRAMTIAEKEICRLITQHQLQL